MKRKATTVLSIVLLLAILLGIASLQAGVTQAGPAPRPESGPVLNWTTFGGSASDDWCKAIVTDDAGNSYIVGDSSAEWGSPVRGFSVG
ncbi:MAG: SBBP repeat-containing protein, partial [Chloroflexi bacterium]|nr:SBBP repeat-containing protein [Chloroflexota bacterium]